MKPYAAPQLEDSAVKYVPVDATSMPVSLGAQCLIQAAYELASQSHPPDLSPLHFIWAALCNEDGLTEGIRAAGLTQEIMIAQFRPGREPA